MKQIELQKTKEMVSEVITQASWKCFVDDSPSECFRKVLDNLREEDKYTIDLLGKLYPDIPLEETVYFMSFSKKIEEDINHEELCLLADLHRKYHNDLTKKVIQNAWQRRMHGWSWYGKWEIENYIKDVINSITKDEKLREAKYDLIASLKYKQEIGIDEYADKITFYYHTIATIPKTMLRTVERWLHIDIKEILFGFESYAYENDNQLYEFSADNNRLILSVYEVC